jgi:glycosyltransferase involved in cell wall biosynthesis
MLNISVILPVFNEKKSLFYVVEKWNSFFKEKNIIHEFVICEDGSTDGTKELIKAKNDDDGKSYKLTKALGIKYCLELTKHMKDWTTHFNSHKKKDDLADAFLQGLYFYNNNIIL